ncbi:hypothetical protein GCM10028856_35630 [Halopiger thermotolerans]
MTDHSADGTDRELAQQVITFRKNEGASLVEADTIHPRVWNDWDPHLQELTPIGRSRPFLSSLAAYAEPQRRQTATFRLWSPKGITSEYQNRPSNFNPFNRYTVGHRIPTVGSNRSLQPEAEQRGDSA